MNGLATCGAVWIPLILGVMLFVAPARLIGSRAETLTHAQLVARRPGLERWLYDGYGGRFLHRQAFTLTRARQTGAVRAEAAALFLIVLYGTGLLLA